MNPLETGTFPHKVLHSRPDPQVKRSAGDIRMRGLNVVKMLVSLTRDVSLHGVVMLSL